MKCAWPYCRKQEEVHCLHGSWCPDHYGQHTDDLERKWRDQWASAKRDQSELMSR